MGRCILIIFAPIHWKLNSAYKNVAARKCAGTELCRIGIVTKIHGWNCAEGKTGIRPIGIVTNWKIAELEMCRKGAYTSDRKFKINVATFRMSHISNAKRHG